VLQYFSKVLASAPCWLSPFCSFSSGKIHRISFPHPMFSIGLIQQAFHFTRSLTMYEVMVLDGLTRNTARIRRSGPEFEAGRRSLVLLLSSYNVRSTAARCDIPAAYVEVDTITLLMIFCCRHNLVCFRRVNDGPAGRGCDRRSTRARNLTLLRSFCQDSRPASLRR
jgi:hypothetical protein